MTALLTAFSDALADLATGITPSLVQVSNGRSGGAGIIWHSDGLILTNAHVIRSPEPQVTLHDGRSFSARVVAHSRSQDLAALKIEARGLPVLPRGDSNALRVGDWVLAIGHPWGVLGSATAGSVIGVGRTPERVGGYDGDLLQVGLHLRPGHSGGPMVNSLGELVGINTMIAGPDVGLAVPIHTIEAFAAEALRHSGLSPSQTFI